MSTRSSLRERCLRFVAEKAIEADEDIWVVNVTSEGVALMEASLVEGQSALVLVEQKARELARTLLASEPCVKVFVFGSRATGRSVTRSDIDLGFDLAHPIRPEVLAAIRDAFDDLPILQRVDVVDFSSVDGTFKTVALQQIKSLYERQAA